jgi:hypothetical protein
MMSPAALQELAGQVRYLLDRQAILDCVVRGVRGLDRHDPELIRSVFHEDAVINIGEFVGTRDAFITWSDAGHRATYSGHAHNVTCQSVDLDGDTAHAETYVIMALRRNADTTVILNGGRYIDRLERRAGTWAIALRRLAVDWRVATDGSPWVPDRPGYPFSGWGRQDVSYERPLSLPPEMLATLRTET